MDEPDGVGCSERARDVLQDAEALFERQPSAIVAAEARAQRLTLDELHREVRDAPPTFAIGLAHVVNGDDVGVLERGSCARLAEDPHGTAGRRDVALGVVVMQHLESDHALKARVARTVHFAHAPFAEQAEDRVALDGVAGTKRHAEGYSASLRIPYFRKRR